MTQSIATNEYVARTIEEHLAREPGVDNTRTFERLQGIMSELRQRVLGRFALTPSASNSRYANYSAPTGACRGSLQTYAGGGIDWLVDSWLGQPESGFTNLHFNTWLGPQTRVPHLAIVFGTIPEIFFYFDFIPRVDLSVDLDYLDRYYEVANARLLGFHADRRFTPFISRSPYMRQSISPVGLCFTCRRDDECIDLLQRTAHAQLDQWLSWLRDAEPVPGAERPALAERDRWIRRAVAERDPANGLAERLLGSADAERLVQLLWGVEERPS